MTKISSWGNLSVVEHCVKNLRATPLTGELTQDKKYLAVGMRRSYGDQCLNPSGILLNSLTLDHFIHFDENSGLLHCESGVLLRDIQKIFIARGWMLPVTPGTQMITVGGAIANDVHGKNHHKLGSFGHHLKEITLVRTEGRSLVCTPQKNNDWFTATVGGLGLTGIIYSAKIQLIKISSAWLNTERVAFRNLNEFIDLSRQSTEHWQYSVGWFDCFDKNCRGIFMRANHTNNIPSPKNKRQKNIPLVPPISLINSLSSSIFNKLYFLNNRSREQKNQYHDEFFYPLDSINHWNRLYGPRGFFQYQCVLPIDTSMEALTKMMNEIRFSGLGSSLSVLKLFGDMQSLGLMSFPMLGITLALDFPNQGKTTLQLFNRLDTILTEHGGRIYLAKDARMSPELLKLTYPNLEKFLKFRDAGISSAMSQRLLGD